ncbi:hypothetical protein QPK06_05165 [Aeromonas veronii]|uniref:hypothetical protein n=1 Tax=Aeromonas veronii TaxID=654 RepID=UPI002542CD71|nr:hypothetical protein [Aeromonas veronii]WIJ42568.1 hypothetical protein QPK06_05165 [Aeromonas veronii]
MNSHLKVELNATKLVISIGKKTLLHAIETGRSYGLGDIKITDKELFFEEIVRELRAESEDGSTLIHEALDQAVSNALENGAEGVEYDD